ncbi:MAG: tetratricopeptide repeat protein [Microscillaceae bacterium]|jgi:signal transduction histidine kinase|nr:tetratricopeptide repeat protein [Microscillaceae bacterium]
MNKYLISIILCFFGLSIGLAQKHKTIDSLQKKLNSKIPDTTKVSVLNKLALNYSYVNLVDAKKNAESALALAQKIKFAPGVAQSYLSLTHIYYTQGNQKMTIDNAFKALKIYEKLADSVGVAGVNNILGVSYIDQKEYTKAEKVIRKSLDLYKTLNDKGKTAVALGNLGIIFSDQKEFKVAQKYHLEALNLYRQIKDTVGISTMLNNLADCQMRLKNYEVAFKYFNEARKLSEMVNDQEGIVIVKIGIAETYLKQNQLANAESLLLDALKLSREIDIPAQEIYILKILSEVYIQKNDFKQALDYFQKYTTLKDSLQGKENLEKIAQMQTFYELEKKEKENLALKQQQIEKNTIISNQRILMWIFGVFVFIQLVLLRLLYRANQSRTRANEELLEKNEEISMFAEELRTKNDEIDRHREELTEINEVKDKLFSIVAHDFRGPLNSLQGVLSLLNAGHLSESEVQYLLNGLTDKVNDTQNLLENLLNWAKAQMQGIEMSPEDFELNRVVNETINVLNPIAKHKNVSLENQIKQTIRVYADDNATRLIIRNLISNAIKFTPNEGKVLISAEIIDQTRVKIAVRDTGVGISPDKQAQLFNIKTHFTSYGTNNEKGTGLGLLLVKDFVQLNEGELGLESHENQGSTFYFTLPLAKD